MPVVFDLGSFGHGKAQMTKNTDDLIFHDRQRMAGTNLHGFGGPRKIGHGGSMVGLFKSLFQIIDPAQREFFQFVDGLANSFFFSGGHVLKVIEQLVQQTFFTGIPDPQSFNFFFG